jgi:hypothetical protein
MYKQEGYQQKIAALIIINLLLNINILPTIFVMFFGSENGLDSYILKQMCPTFI